MGNLLTKVTSTTPSPAEKMGPVPLKHFAKAQSTFNPPLIAHDNHFLGDVVSRSVPTLRIPQSLPRNSELTTALVCWFISDKLDHEKPVTCGFYRLEAGKELVYTYTYHEMKIILEGEVDISDETGQAVHAVAGDVFYFPKGSVITFKTKSHCKAFYTGQRPEGTA
jgi:uncharacterized cupin superfamily protein